MSKSPGPDCSEKRNGQSMAVSVPMAERLAGLERAFGALAQANSLEEVKSIRDKAEAVRQLVRNAKTGLEVQNRAAELKLRAERRAGELLQALHFRGGDRRSGTWRSRPSLKELGISEQQSKHWQLEATVPEAEFQAFLDAANANGQELTSKALRQLASARLGRDPKPRHREMIVPAEQISEIQERAPTEDSSTNPPLGVLAEIRNHCTTLEGILAPTTDETNGNGRHPCVTRALRRLTGEIRNLLTELERWADTSSDSPGAVGS